MAERARSKHPLFAFVWVGMALVIHVAGIALFIWISSLLPEHKIPDEPKEMEVTWIETPAPTPEPSPMLAMEPQPAEPAPTLDKAKVELPPDKKAPAKPEPKKPEPKKPEPKLPVVAKVDPPKPPPPQPPKPEAKKPPPPPPPKPAEAPKPALVKEDKPPKPPEPEKPKPPLKMERHKMVELDDDKHLVNEPPPDAEYWSDKNRRVAEQTRDTRTNLEKMSKGEASPSEKNPNKDSTEVGGADDKIHQLENAEQTSLQKKNLDPTAHDGSKDKAIGRLTGANAQDGKEGQNGDKGQGGKPGALSMRNIAGRGAPGAEPSPNVAPSGANDDAPEVAMSPLPGAGGPAGRTGREGAPGKSGPRGPKLDIDHEQYERIIGDDKMHDEAELAKRQTSHKKGRWEAKLDRIHQSLENFTPEVKPGNQTALGTRAAPFAVYIARMHRKIHELWGFGFLADLDGKSSSDPMNDKKLEVTLEIVLNSDGTVDKTTIAKPSGVLTFDVAAIDSVESAGPYEETPKEIRSPNGKVYIHWAFHRDERQCTPYFADPFILDNAPPPGQDGAKSGLPEPGEEIARRRREGPQKITRNPGSPTEPGANMAHVTEPMSGDPAATARANANMPTPDDPSAQDVALRWANAFENGRLDELVAVSSTPFTSAGAVVATDAGKLASVWRNILDEIPARRIKEWKLLSAGGYRAVFGHLPKGEDVAGTSRLFLAVRVGSEWLTMDVIQGGDGKYHVTGMSR